MNNNIDNNDEKNIKLETKPNIKKPVILTIVLILINIVLYLQFEKISNTCNGFDCLSKIVPFLTIMFNIVLILIIWLSYSIKLSIKKHKNNEKHSFGPVLISTICIIITILILNIPNFIKTNYNYISSYAEIVSFENVSDIPNLEGYLILSEDIKKEEVFENIDNYKNKKVLVKGTPYYRELDNIYEKNISLLIGEKSTFAICEEDDDDRIFYNFNFVDKNSEFKNDGYIFFANGNKSREDYYVYVYGTIKSISSDFVGGRTERKININPEKIYYTSNLDKVSEE